ncbi:exported hypothetical protein [Nostocoides australiense Ben110]|uniref:Uncharacterized protein n=1 Tax=Nostocoides australiense Ben110 TaxID=1193182 RepID=W6JU66_9MICO|nr:hypothetical protein [Tetrasphaera australiensis]CCH72015.1 exported hypothetical protein [Tetrasphaera australiensis Ben110]
MRRSSTMLVAGAVTALACGVVAAPAGAESAPPSRPGTQVPVYAGPLDGTTSLIADDTSGKAARTARITVTYHGFNATSKAAFQRAVDMWSTKISSPVPITVDATWAPLGSNILGSAGSNYIWKVGGVWQGDAIANKKAGRQLNSAPDIVARFSSSFTNWHFGTGPAPAGKYDFTSVVAHEIGHGLGFWGVGRVNGALGTVRYNGANGVYDRYTKLGSSTGSPLLWKMPDNSTKLGSALRSNNLYFDSPAVRNANGGKAARLYAPGTWRQGSSYSHLNESTYPKGNPNSLMTYAIGGGETIRTPGNITMAIFKTIGW